MDASGLTAAATCRSSLPAPPIAPRRVRVLSALLLYGIVLGLACVGAKHIYWRHPDFEYFYSSAAWLAHHGSPDPGFDRVGGRVTPRGTLDWYWPFVPRLMTTLTALPYGIAGYLWVTLNLVALVATLRLLGRHLCGLPPRDWPVTQLVPFLLLLPYWLWEFRLNQINTLTLLLLVGSFACWERGRGLLAGFWLGLAVLLKLTPGLLLLWFALKRQYRTAASALLVVVLAGPAADLVVFGPADTAALYRAWAQRAVRAGSHQGLILGQRETDWRNQGVGVVLSRWLHATNYNTHFDNDPRIQADYAHLAPATMNVLNLPLPVVANIALVVVAGPLLALIWFARRPAGQLTLWQLRFEWALFMLAMLWCMPVMRRYHLICALPALSLLAAGVHYSGFSSRWSKLALTCLGVTLAVQLTLLSMELEAGGTLLAAIVALAIPLVAMLLRLNRAPRLLSEPHYAWGHPVQAAVRAAPLAPSPAAAPA